MKCSQFALLPGAAVPLSPLPIGYIPGAGDIEAGSTQPLPSQSSWPGRAPEVTSRELNGGGTKLLSPRDSQDVENEKEESVEANCVLSKRLFGDILLPTRRHLLKFPSPNGPPSCKSKRGLTHS